MYRPSAQEILKSSTDSYYSLVVAVAKRAREIAQEAEESKTPLIVKPVQLAVQEFAKGEFAIGYENE